MFMGPGWLGGTVVRYRTNDSRVRFSPELTTVINLEQVIYTRGVQVNSAFHPIGVGK